MLIPLMYVLIGYAMLFTLLTDSGFNELPLLNSTFEKVVTVLAWPAILAVLFLWRFCRGDSEDPEPVL